MRNLFVCVLVCCAATLFSGCRSDDGYNDDDGYTTRDSSTRDSARYDRDTMDRSRTRSDDNAPHTAPDGAFVPN